MCFQGKCLDNVHIIDVKLVTYLLLVLDMDCRLDLNTGAVVDLVALHIDHYNARILFVCHLLSAPVVHALCRHLLMYNKLCGHSFGRAVDWCQIHQKCN